MHADLGAEAINAGRAQDAMKAYDEALKYDPDLAEAHLGKGVVYELAFGKLDEAEAEYRKAIALKPTLAEAHNNLGQLLARTGRLEEAVKEFDVASSIMLYREPWVARCNKGQALWRMGKKEEGVAELKACLNFQPKYCQGWRELGRIQLADGQGKDAVGSFEQYAKTCDKSADAQQLLGTALLRDRTGGPGTRVVPEVRRARPTGRPSARSARRAASNCGDEWGRPSRVQIRAPRRSAPSAATSCGSGTCAGCRAEDVARVTRLAPAVIDAIEAGDPERMPPRGYLVGYLRSYAGAVGLDADDVVLRYQEAAGAEDPSRRRARRAPAPGRSDRRLREGVAGWRSRSCWPCSWPRRWPSASGAAATTRARSADASPRSARPTGPPARRRRSRVPLRQAPGRGPAHGRLRRAGSRGDALQPRAGQALGLRARRALLAAPLRRRAGALHPAGRRGHGARRATCWVLEDAGGGARVRKPARRPGPHRLRQLRGRAGAGAGARRRAARGALRRGSSPTSACSTRRRPAPGTCGGSSSTRCAPRASSPRSTGARAADARPARARPASTRSREACSARRCASTGGAGARPIGAACSRRCGRLQRGEAVEAGRCRGGRGAGDPRSLHRDPPRQEAPVAPLPRRGGADALVA